MTKAKVTLDIPEAAFCIGIVEAEERLRRGEALRDEFGTIWAATDDEPPRFLAVAAGVRDWRESPQLQWWGDTIRTYSTLVEYEAENEEMSDAGGRKAAHLVGRAADDLQTHHCGRLTIMGRPTDEQQEELDENARERDALYTYLFNFFDNGEIAGIDELAEKLTDLAIPRKYWDGIARRIHK